MNDNRIKTISSLFIGLLLGIYIFIQYGVSEAIVIMPPYCLGTLYSIDLIIRAIKNLTITYIKAQFVSLLASPVIGTILCLSLFIISMCFVICTGWIVGLYIWIRSAFNTQ